MHHLISAAQHRRQYLFVVFVDFRKAFDTVRRDLLLERCQELGIHGPFMDILVALYDRVCCKVAVHGQLGEEIHTAAGTKQGSELSPLLFGLFIELLHELLKLKLPGAGPVLAGLRVPDILYADDVALVSHSSSELQSILDVLDVFCRLFGMEVNLAPRKTCAVVFRKHGMRAPRGFRLMYRGHEVTVQQRYVYLGVSLHETRGILGAGEALAAAGSRAMHALLTRCRRANLTQFDIKGRMFDVLVEPVLSYASHIWGPTAFSKCLRSKPYAPEAEKVHAAFLRTMTGVGKGASLDVLYRDLHRLPIIYHWVCLAARWWSRLQVASGGPQQTEGRHAALAYCAWREDVALALQGCRACWSYQFLHTMSSLGLLSADWQQQPLDWVLQQRWDEVAVKRTLTELFKARWQPDPPANPRLAPSVGLSMCTHRGWVYPFDASIPEFTRANAPSHNKLCLPFVVLRCYAQLRLGWAHLEIDRGRQRRPQVPRVARLCRLCSGEQAPLARRQAVLARTGTSDNVEDLLHFVLECPVYDDLRVICPAFPRDLTMALSGVDCLPAVFMHKSQSSLAYTLFRMKCRRADLLGLDSI
jgi:sorting nexin-29